MGGTSTISTKARTGWAFTGRRAVTPTGRCALTGNCALIWIRSWPPIPGKRVQKRTWQDANEAWAPSWLQKGDTAHGVENLHNAMSIFDELSRIDRAHNLEKLEPVAATFSDMADALSRAASLPRITAAARIARWQEARSA